MSNAGRDPESRGETTGSKESDFSLKEAPNLYVAQTIDIEKVVDPKAGTTMDDD